MVLRQLVLGDENETGQPRLRGEQVVIRRIAAAVADVVADRQQIAGGIVQEGEVHHRLLGATLGELIDPPDALGGAVAPGGRAGQLLQGRHVIELPGIGNEELQIVPRGVALPDESVRPPLLFRVAVGGQRGDITAEFLEQRQRGREIGRRRRLQLFTEPIDRRRRQHFQGIAQPGKDARRHDGLALQFQQSGPQGVQAPRRDCRYRHSTRRAGAAV